MPASSRFGRSFCLLCVLSCTFATLQACGGRSDTEDYLLGDGGPIDGPNGFGNGNTGASSSGGRSPGPGSAGAPSAGGAATGGSGIPPGGTTGLGGVAAGGASSAGAAQGGAGVAGSGAAGGADSAPITCGSRVCNAVRETCCVTVAGFACIPEEDACGGAILSCGAAADCSGDDVCCLRVLGEVGSSSACKSSCRGMGPDRERQLCRTDEECAGNRRCRDTVFGISVCTRF